MPRGKGKAGGSLARAAEKGSDALDAPAPFPGGLPPGMAQLAPGVGGVSMPPGMAALKAALPEMAGLGPENAALLMGMGERAKTWDEHAEKIMSLWQSGALNGVGGFAERIEYGKPIRKGKTPAATPNKQAD